MCRLFKFSSDYDALVHSEPLSTLIESCESRCFFPCCGYDACDISPDTMVKYFFSSEKIQSKYTNKNELVALLINQALNLKNDFGGEGVIQKGYVHSGCSNVYWTGLGIDILCENIIYCLKVLSDQTSVDPAYDGETQEYEYHHSDEVDPDPKYEPNLAKLIHFCKKRYEPITTDNEITGDEDMELGYDDYEFSFDVINSYTERYVNDGVSKKTYTERLKNELSVFERRYKETGFFWAFYEIKVTGNEIQRVSSLIKKILDNILDSP